MIFCTRGWLIMKDCGKQRLQTTVSINLWKILAGHTGDWFDVKTASICTTELWDALKSFILTSLKFKVAPYPIIVSLDTLSLSCKCYERKFCNFLSSPFYQLLLLTCFGVTIVCERFGMRSESTGTYAWLGLSYWGTRTFRKQFEKFLMKKRVSKKKSATFYTTGPCTKAVFACLSPTLTFYLYHVQDWNFCTSRQKNRQKNITL